jgi:hypothetical protein
MSRMRRAHYFLNVGKYFKGNVNIVTATINLKGN